MKLFRQLLLFYFVSFFAISCSKDTTNSILPAEENYKELTIFHINDQHGKLDNFSKIKYIVDKEKNKQMLW
jgi:2',3'-cyclic-nucleotide 2'-phosphodiesterase (5'-nucleotidase family)